MNLSFAQFNHLLSVKRLPREELDEPNALKNFGRKPDPLVRILDTLGSLFEHDRYEQDLDG
jgi:hypothetical protein